MRDTPSPDEGDPAATHVPMQEYCHPREGGDPLPRSDNLKKRFLLDMLFIMDKHGYVYIMANAPLGTLYIGSTTDLVGRVFEHKNKVYPKSFTARYNCNILVYYEQFDSLENMVEQERQLKKWNRNWKLRLIIKKNPDWKDLYPDVLNAMGYDAM